MRKRGSRDERELYGECGEGTLRGMRRSHVFTDEFSGGTRVTEFSGEEMPEVYVGENADV